MQIDLMAFLPSLRPLDHHESCYLPNDILRNPSMTRGNVGTSCITVPEERVC